MKNIIKSIFNLPKRIAGFISATIRELKYISWLRPKQVFTYSLFVIFVTVFVTILTLGFDSTFVQIRNILINSI